MATPLARALSNPLRGRLLFEFHRETSSPSRLAERLDQSLKLVSYHTRVLRELGCIELVGTARRRGAIEHFYRGVVDPAVEDEQWGSLPLAVRRELTHRVLQEAIEDARRAAFAGGFDGTRSHLSRRPLALDEAGVDAVSSLLRGLMDEVAKIEAASRARAEPIGEHELLILCFPQPSTP